MPTSMSDVHRTASAPISADVAARLLTRAYRHVALEQPTVALALLRKAAQSPSHAVEAFTAVASIERARGRPADALAAYRRALSFVTDEAKLAALYAQIGGLYFELYEDDEAAVYFRRAIRLDSRHAYLLEPTRPSISLPPHDEPATQDSELPPRR